MIAFNRVEPKLEETKRVARILRIVQMISGAPGIYTRARIAERFEISQRQIDSDLQVIRHALGYEIGRRKTGYYFQSGPMMRPIQFSTPQALALAIAVRQALEAGSVEPEVMDGALHLIEDALPPGDRSVSKPRYVQPAGSFRRWPETGADAHHAEPRAGRAQPRDHHLPHWIAKRCRPIQAGGAI